MKRVSVRLAALIILIATLSAFAGFAIYKTQAQPTPFPTSPPPETPSAAVVATIRDSIFGESSCSLPCWQGITPGNTTSQEALRILQNSPLINIDSLQTNNFKNDSGRTYWNWKGVNFPSSMQPNYYWSNKIVHDIFLFPGSDITVEEVINKFGTPEKVEVNQTGIPESPEWSMTLLYDGNGFEIQINDLFGWEETQLKPSTPITSIVLFEPTTFEERILSKGLDIQHFQTQDWKGYGIIYDLYFR